MGCRISGPFFLVTKIPGQVKARDSKIVCGENICKHWTISWCCDGSGESSGQTWGDSV